MKKTYERPRMETQRFDVEDTITVSSPPAAAQPLDNVNTQYQSPIFPVY